MDIINGCFEAFGMFFILPSIFKLHREKKVAGVSWVHAAFFATWGYWNCLFYPSIDQWFSFYGGIGIAVANTVWLCQLIRYHFSPAA